MAGPDDRQLPQRSAVHANFAGRGHNGVGGQRPNRISSGTLANPTIDLWFDKTAFVVPDPFTFGNAGAGILRADHQWNVDASLFKRFGLTNGRRIELRAEAFNLLNSVYFAAPNTVIDTAAGGRVTSTSNQAAVRSG
jgi:hypothetical protein